MLKYDSCEAIIDINPLFLHGALPEEDGLVLS